MAGLIGHFWGASLYAGALVAAVLAVLRLSGRPAGRRDLPALCLIVLFLSLTQLPFPSAATMTCPTPMTAPEFMPGNSVLHVISQVRHWGWRVAVFKDSTVIAAAMNYLLCFAIGWALVWQGRLSNRAILVFGAAMTLAVELTQLTGTWGLFPCAYRKFDADDLVLNFLGVASGLYWGRARARRQA